MKQIRIWDVFSGFYKGFIETEIPNINQIELSKYDELVVIGSDGKQVIQYYDVKNALAEHKYSATSDLEVTCIKFISKSIFLTCGRNNIRYFTK